MSHKKDKTNLLLSIIVVLLLLLVVAAFFIGKGMNSGSSSTNYDNSNLTVKIINDKRCSTCDTTQLEAKLKQVPSLSNKTFEKLDFADVKSYVEENNIKALPAVVFNKGFVDMGLNDYLKPLPNNDYSLEIGSKFNPFEKRSDRGFKIISKDIIKKIKDNSYIKGNSDAKITWVEYSDLECPYCAKLHNNNTTGELSSKYPTDLNIAFNHFPLGFHKNAQAGAEALECVAEQTNSDKFYSLIEASFKKYNSNNFSLNGFYDLAAEEGANKEAIKKCVESGKYTQKVKDQMALGASEFGITGTPGNVLINNQTGEYEVISGAYPTASFIEIIEKLK